MKSQSLRDLKIKFATPEQNIEDDIATRNLNINQFKQKSWFILNMKDIPDSDSFTSSYFQARNNNNSILKSFKLKRAASFRRPVSSNFE